MKGRASWLSPATAALLVELQEVVRSKVRGVGLPTGIVHFDFHADNILATSHGITGVIDCQRVSGDRVLDLT